MADEGPVGVDEAVDAIERIAQQGRLAGAFLDVLEIEPLAADSPLWTLPNVMVTPHTASHSVGYYTRVGELFLDNLSRWVDGKALVNDATRYRQSAPG